MKLFFPLLSNDKLQNWLTGVSPNEELLKRNPVNCGKIGNGRKYILDRYVYVIW